MIKQDKGKEKVDKPTRKTREEELVEGIARITQEGEVLLFALAQLLTSLDDVGSKKYSTRGMCVAKLTDYMGKLDHRLCPALQAKVDAMRGAAVWPRIPVCNMCFAHCHQCKEWIDQKPICQAYNDANLKVSVCKLCLDNCIKVSATKLKDMQSMLIGLDAQIAKLKLDRECHATNLKFAKKRREFMQKQAKD